MNKTLRIGLVLLGGALPVNFLAWIVWRWTLTLKPRTDSFTPFEALGVLALSAALLVPPIVIGAGFTLVIIGLFKRSE